MQDWLRDGCVGLFSLPLGNEVLIADRRSFGGLFGVFYNNLSGGWVLRELRDSMSTIMLNLSG